MDERSRPPLFSREPYEGPHLTRVGDGAIGGKAAGLWFAQQRILGSIDRSAYPPELSVEIPRGMILTTTLFDAFLRENRIDPVELEKMSDTRIVHTFLQGRFPAGSIGDLRSLVEQVRQPIAVRSSSRLEDALDHPFAGVYATKMIPNDQHAPDQRFRKLIEAIKFVWASTFFAAARSYRESLAGTCGGEGLPAESMAVLVQEVVGREHGERFYPTLSGVARSYNYYPTGHAEPEDGVVDLALGLGRQIVDGGTSWTYSPAYPKAPPPFGSTADRLRSTQLDFWAVHMGTPPIPDPARETEFLCQGGIKDAEEDGELRWLVSTYDPSGDRFYPGLYGAMPRALDFAPLLVENALPLNQVVRDVLRAAEKETGGAVEIEFAVTLDPGGALPARFALLQVRGMRVSAEAVVIGEDDLSADDVLLATESALGNGLRDDICDIVYLKPNAFARSKTSTIARELAVINGGLVSECRPYLLIGFGRWGSSDPWLGVPVEWGQVSGARVIVERTLPDLMPDFSQGSHFFHNMVGLQVCYLSVRHDGTHDVDWDGLAELPAVSETRYVRHVRAESPLTVKVDGKGRRAVVRWG